MSQQYSGLFASNKQSTIAKKSPSFCLFTGADATTNKRLTDLTYNIIVDKRTFANPPPNVSCFVIQATAKTKLLLPAQLGSTLRGVLGHALLASYCRCEEPTVHNPGCLYTYLFEGHRRDQQDGIPAVMLTPIDRNRQVPAGDTFKFRATFIGLSAALQQAVITSLATGLQTGLTRHLTSCELVVASPMPIHIQELNQALTINLTSPWLIKRQGKPIKAHAIKIHDILVAIAQRQRMVTRHFDIDLPNTSNKQLLALADQLTVTASLQDERWERNSSRQSQRHPLSGVTGQITITHPSPEGLAPLNTLLAYGALLHGGGKTSLGLGGLHVTAIAARTQDRHTSTPRLNVHLCH
jgi:hypothetical protein